MFFKLWSPLSIGAPCNFHVLFSWHPLGELTDQFKTYRLPHKYHLTVYQYWWLLLDHSHLTLPESAWLSLLHLPHLDLKSWGGVVANTVCVSTVNIRCIQAWGWIPLFCSAFRCWYHAHRWCRHDGLSYPMLSTYGILPLYCHNWRRCFQVHCKTFTFI